MNVIPSAAVLSLVLVLSGCATSTQVQEMIDASRQDYLKRSDSHTASIDLLKKSSIAALEKNKANAAAIAELNAELDSTQAQLKLIRGYADAAKITISAASQKTFVCGRQFINSLFVFQRSNAYRDAMHKKRLLGHLVSISGAERLRQHGVPPVSWGSAWVAENRA